MSRRSAWALLLLALLLGSALVVFYGPDVSSIATIGALIAIPTSMGALLSHVTDPDGKLSTMGCFVWPAVAVCALVAVAWAVIGEGAVCIAMILPLWIPAAIGGAIIQQLNRRHFRAEQTDSARFSAVTWLVLPLTLLGLEQQFVPDWQERKVERQIDIPASPDALWPSLVTIDTIGPHEGRWNFSQDVLGIPRPAGATLVKEDGALVRKAAWQQGVRFEERITEIEPGRRICWRFSFQDSSLQMVADRHISPDGPYLKIERGCYLLQALPGGRTRVTLATTYRMRVQLADYFALWGERLLGDVEENVLRIVADRAATGH